MKILKKYIDFLTEEILPKDGSWLNIPKSPKGQFLEAPKVDPNDIKDIKLDFEPIEANSGEEMYKVIFP